MPVVSAHFRSLYYLARPAAESRHSSLYVLLLFLIFIVFIFNDLIHLRSII